MQNKWEYKKLGEICSTVTDYVANGSFASLKKNVNYKANKDYAVLIRLSDYSRSFAEKGRVYINKNSYDFLKKSSLQPNQIIISNVGEYSGTVFKTPNLGVPMTLGPNAITIKTNYCDDFYFYWLSSNEGKNALYNIRSGSAVPKFNKTEFKTIIAPCPPLGIQIKIANILNSLSSQIENNQKIISNLEKTAQLLFKQWFVDFEFPDENGRPYKSSGGEMVESEFGLIPKGWRNGSLGEIINIHDNLRKPLSSREREIRKGDYPYYGATTEIGRVDNYLFDGTYLLVGEDGTVTTNEGFAVTQYLRGKFWVSNHAHVLTGKSGFSTELIKIILDTTNIEAYVTGAVQPKLNQGNMVSIPIIMPTLSITEKLSKVATSFLDLIFAYRIENDTLIKTRDLLLPKLISGEVEV